MSMLVSPKQVIIIDIEGEIFVAKIDQISHRSYPRKNLRLKRTLIRSLKLHEVMASALGYCAGVRENRTGIVNIEFSRRFEEHFADEETFKQGAKEPEQYHYLFPEDAEERNDTSLVH